MLMRWLVQIEHTFTVQNMLAVINDRSMCHLLMQLDTSLCPPAQDLINYLFKSLTLSQSFKLQLGN